MAGVDSPSHPVTISESSGWPWPGFTLVFPFGVIPESWLLPQCWGLSHGCFLCTGKGTGTIDTLCVTAWMPVLGVVCGLLSIPSFIIQWDPTERPLLRDIY